MSQRRRVLCLVGVLSLGAVGCELVVDFDRTKIDAGPIGQVDGGEQDVVTVDVNQPDTTVHQDAGPDTNQPDTNQPDTNEQDSNVADTNVADTNVADTNVADTNVADTNVADTNVADTNVADTNVADTNLPDTNLPDTNLPDTNLPDTNLPDTNLPDTNPAQCNGLDPSAVPVVTATDSTSAAPTLGGGALPAAGTWFLTAQTYYLPDGGSSGRAGRQEQAEIQVTGPTVQLAVLDVIDGGSTLQTQTFTIASTSANTFDSTPVCPSAGAPQPNQYETSGDGGPGTVFTVTSDGVQYLTFTLQ